MHNNQVAAGNKNIDAADVSPSHADGAIVVGASNIADTRTWFSTFGCVVDLFAPGENIISAGIDGPTVNDKTQGNVSPAAMRALLKELALKNVLTDIRIDLELAAGTPNKLAHYPLP
ncbi:hypothetical protein C0995_003013 [Termitomyces sp. Mi166|nr:hypothetical protein C0995_003013 [Termitomyces sp. Mi166\